MLALLALLGQARCFETLDYSLSDAIHIHIGQHWEVGAGPSERDGGWQWLSRYVVSTVGEAEGVVTYVIAASCTGTTEHQ
jgi:hypothetical protein